MRSGAWLDRSGQRKLLAVAVGVLLAGLPLAALDIWFEGVIARRGGADVSTLARRTVAVIDSRLATVAASLDGLAAQGIAACGPADLDKLRRALFVTSPAKELSVVGPDGETMCTDRGVSPGARTVVNVSRVAGGGDMQIEVVRLGDQPANYVRVRRMGTNGVSLAGLVPIDILTPVTSTQGGRLDARAQVFTRDGLLIGEGGAALPAPIKSDVVNATARSDRYGITVTVTAPSAAEVFDLRIIGLLVNVIVVTAILVLAALHLRRRDEDPLADMRRALDAGEFVPYYQPIVDITSGKVLAAEVLARWRKGDGTLVLPGAFIPLAERSGLMVEMTEALMRRACTEVGDAYARRPRLEIAFNLTARHFADDTIVDDLREIFDRSPIALSQVTLELTERQPIEDLTATRRVIAALQGLGCRVALDDVGTGHSGLSSLLRLGVDVIKIDKMFIDSLGSERNSATIVTTMVELARNMGMHVVAEGVETFEQVADLRSRGIRAAQGYVFAPPLPGSSYVALLDAVDPAAKPAVEGARRQGTT